MNFDFKNVIRNEILSDVAFELDLIAKSLKCLFENSYLRTGVGYYIQT